MKIEGALAQVDEMLKEISKKGLVWGSSYWLRDLERFRKILTNLVASERARKEAEVVRVVKRLLVKFIDECNTIQEVEDVDLFWDFEKVNEAIKSAEEKK